MNFIYRIVFIFCIICFVSCELFKNSDNKGDLFQNLGHVNLKSDWRDNLKLNKEEFDTLTFFVNALKNELPKGGSSHFDIYLQGDVSKIEGYIKRFLLKLNDKGKVKELLKHIKYGKDNPLNIEGRDEKLNIDAKDYYKIEKRLTDVFDNYFMFLNPPSSPSGPPPLIENDPEEKVFESIKKVCYEHRHRNKN
ncbi:hypothetical protein bpuSUM_001856 (plasmid) [Borrelia puertoricensis]|nr:hypothetical protein bpuSUM_001593 [Borrelia puertoricensis]UPA19171.1 hypothetical protein bpuSUM_001730 [Borrelia puertoricensis]UPA19304.1 hypothetical protein bpuSUM_001856 [Borrelia puertoricensis]